MAGNADAREELTPLETAATGMPGNAGGGKRTDQPMSEIGLLQRTFEEFNDSARRLHASYGQLESRLRQIGAELEAANGELRRSVAEKEEMQEFLRNILDSLGTAVVVTDLEGWIRIVNRCAAAFSGLAREVLQDSHIGVLFEDLKPPAGNPLLDSPYFRTEGGIRIRMLGRTLEVSGSPLTAKEGAAGAVFLMRDISRIEKLEETTKRAETFAAMGEVAATIAHEIRNPLGSIELFASLLFKDIRNRRNREHARQIISAVKGIDGKISNLLLHARSPHPFMRPVSVHDLLRGILLFSEEVLDQEEVILSVRYADAEPCVQGDPEMLKQLFISLIINALRAMPEEGRLRIETSCIDTGGPFSEGCGQVEIRFSDDGRGLSRGGVERIFDSSGDSRDGGCGLGLAIAHNIVDLHRGSIRLEAGETGGTIFSILLPVIGLAGELHRKKD